GLVDLLNCPVMSTQAARSSVPLDHPNFLHGYSPAGDAARREADVVLVAGSRLGNLDTPYDKYWGDPARQRLIQIDIEPRDLGVTRPLALGIVSDVKPALEGLHRSLGTRPIRSNTRENTGRLVADSQRWRAEKAAVIAEWKGPGIHPAHAMLVVGTVFGRDAIYVTDGGNTSLWAHATLPPTRPRSYLNILELGMLGTGIPSAIGAQLGNPSREVVCVTGDGAAGFHFMEMQSAAREQLPIRTIVFAEGSWTMEELNERMLYGKTFGTEMGTVRWDRVGEGLGCAGFYVDRIEDLEAALTRAREVKGPAVVCIRTSREANLAIPGDMLMRFVEVYQGPMGQ
ncbi:MAG: thiamine pyrophosphate-dependent enzyme, partial [Candidatus Binataceae bacterium]